MRRIVSIRCLADGVRFFSVTFTHYFGISIRNIYTKGICGIISYHDKVKSSAYRKTHQ